MGVEGSYGFEEGFLKYVSNYNRELYKKGLGCVVWLCCLEQDEEVQGWGEALFQEKKKNAFNDKLESAANICSE